MTPGASTWRMFRALAWLRWRMLINSITRSGARDILERLSRTAESLLPVAVVVLLVPAAVAMLALGGWTGSRLTVDPQAALGLQFTRWVLALMLVLTLLGPMLFPAGQQLAGMVRLLLLPVPARVLYASHALGGLTDPWIFLTIPLLGGMAGGALAAGALRLAAVTLMAGLAFLLVLLGIAALSSATLQLLVRNRRRAELLVLVGMLFIVLVSLVPSALIPDEGKDVPRRTRGELAIPRWVHSVGSALPSELYVSVASLATAGRDAEASSAAAGLFAWAAVAHALTWPIYQRLLRTPSSGGGERRIARGARLHVALPGVGPRTSAVAVSYVRLALRTPRGRTIVLMPILMLAMFGAIFYFKGSAMPIGPVSVGMGYSLGIFGLTLALLSIAPFAFNQFAVDRAGLTLQFLAPISTRELLYGKAIGGALIAAMPCIFSIVAGVVTGGRSAWLWLCVALGALGAYILLSPIAAVLSLIFPRTVDLSSVGQASNAHQAAGLLGVLAFAACCVPPIALSLLALRFLGGPAAAAGLLALWAAAATGLAYVGFLIAERLLDERKENLAMVSSGR